MKKTIKYIILSFIINLLYITPSSAQYSYGTTGLLHAPSADMQKDGTFILGGSIIDVATLAGYWKNHNEYKPFTYNYYLNITLFPWLEVSYTCTLVKGLYGNTYWPEQTWGKFVNQDRSFHGRLRIWKEGWWKNWTPQIVLGLNDPGSHETHGGGDITLGGGGGGNHNYHTRYYLAATKHFNFEGIGNLGIHTAYVIGKAMSDEHYKRPSFGVNFRFHTNKENTYLKFLNGLNLIAEYDARTINVGGHYSLCKDYINIVAELNHGKYFCGGVYFKIPLKKASNND